ncbi:Tfp pilus assembly protein PilV [Anaerohalosphaera lusitana]|uniref:Tfp pilus assembly protein PilV n=1 Tax=Anaerohalosphaera lusitana TaxID=1936003 RepID=A0A1U9NL53_9BACT|nr:prepilin-type N-terminal cleavage/methylation domain-containing protein [Anaerohalosphaera lusitana]AQT68527.1 Tfp pilus assembly protein PilV [Anaerohalosphaera lusitana]
MSFGYKNKGFSLLEVMIAAGILAVGFMLIVAMWPAAIKLTAMSTERTIGAVAADEAAVKMPLYGVANVDQETVDNANIRYQAVAASDKYAYIVPNDVDGTLVTTGVNDVYVDLVDVTGWPWDPLAKDGEGNDIWDFSNETAYPSTETFDGPKHYHWSALCKYNDDVDNFAVTDRTFDAVVFVCRLGIENKVYPYVNVSGNLITSPLPRPMRVFVDYKIQGGLITGFEVSWLTSSDLSYDKKENLKLAKFMTENVSVVDDRAGRLLAISNIEITESADDKSDAVKGDVLTAILAKDFSMTYPSWVDTPGEVEAYLKDWPVWFIPHAIGGGKSPCVGVYHKNMLRF